MPLKECPACKAQLPTACKSCGTCGHAFGRYKNRVPAAKPLASPFDERGMLIKRFTGPREPVSTDRLI